MERKIVRVLTIVFIVVLQISFLPIFFSAEHIPQVLLALVVVWTIVLGFRVSVPWIIGLGITFDLLTPLPVGTSVIILIVVSYGVSFVSSRYITTHRLWGALLMGGILFTATFFENIYTIILPQILQGGESLLGQLQSVSFYDLLFQTIFLGISFAILFQFVRRMEKYFSFFERQIDVKRHL